MINVYICLHFATLMNAPQKHLLSVINAFVSLNLIEHRRRPTGDVRLVDGGAGLQFATSDVGCKF